MIGLIIALALGALLGIAKVCIRTCVFDRGVYEKTYACPNCGTRFCVKWYQMIYKTYSVSVYNGAYLKCPACHKKDMCSIVYDER